MENPMMKEMMQEMMNLLKSNFEGSMQTISMIQEQNEKIARMMAEQAAATQNEGKQFADQWLENVKKNQQEYCNLMKTQMEKFEQFFNPKK